MQEYKRHTKKQQHRKHQHHINIQEAQGLQIIRYTISIPSCSRLLSINMLTPVLCLPFYRSSVYYYCYQVYITVAKLFPD